MSNEQLRGFSLQDENSIFWDAVRDFEQDYTPVFGLENKTPYDEALRRNMNNPNYGYIFHTDPQSGYTYPKAITQGYWDEWKRYRGSQVLPEGYPAKDYPNSQEYTRRLISPTDNPATPYYTGNRASPPSPFYVNAMADKRVTVRNPVIASPRVRYTPTTPAEKAAYLASQAERGFTMVGEPYTPVTDTRLAPRTMLSTERVPYYGDYRAGSIPPASGKPFMTAGQAARYIPHYLARPDVARDLMAKAGTAGNALGAAGIIANAYNRATADYENPVTGETFSKDEVKKLDGLNYANADLETIAMFHPDNAENHPEITDAMRDKFFKKKKK
jgi:hypothetical protein